MMAIPKRLLIHTGSIRDVVDKDAWGNEVLSDPVMLSRIRVDPSTKYVRDKSNQEIQLAAVVIYDCRNSRPGGLTFCADQVIAFDGSSYRVQVVEPFYDGRRLHHYEIGVIRDAKNQHQSDV